MATTTTFVSSSNICGGLLCSPRSLIEKYSAAAGPSGSELLSMAPLSRTAAAARDYSLKPLFSSSKLLRLSVRRATFMVRAKRPDGADDPREALDISVFRFTLGIPGFDDAELPRILGIVFGGLLILNHALSGSSPMAAQLRSEGVGLVLAAVCIALPGIGRQLNSANQRKQPLPGQKQIFSLGDGLTDRQRQELAWGSYNLLRNTTTTATLVWHSGRVVSARGLWGVPTDSDPGTAQPLEWLQGRLRTKADDFLNLQEPFYQPARADSRGWDFVPDGAASIIVQPFEPKERNSSMGGFLLAISNTEYGYRRKDRYWTAALARKLSDVLDV